jgi:hypothetical protein
LEQGLVFGVVALVHGVSRLLCSAAKKKVAEWPPLPRCDISWAMGTIGPIREQEPLKAPSYPDACPYAGSP